ncbi:hypothetical protein BA768_18915 [Chryseobacterium sp. CBo1]|uniref:Uncharacterized protein n=1 Tax=Candidatus Chryseobacterium massiliense TaxID=204089 RepID=A0A3D9AI21_9FLAO|nr:hypothetical protein BA768_18915 [Chryseobacterium sp. CBo1]REC40805.1 hypothetical protein DRF68_19575 [Candidatus Chryseobacterium massiliae]
MFFPTINNPEFRLKNEPPDFFCSIIPDVVFLCESRTWRAEEKNSFGYLKNFSRKEIFQTLPSPSGKTISSVHFVSVSPVLQVL